jgi:RNA polymerase sigma-70 factor (ECF subfamily)
MAIELDDTALMMRYCDGDAAAFDTLYARHRGPLFRFLLRQIGSQQFAEDVFQEVWSRIIRNRQGYRPTAKFTTYMYHIARNCSVDHFRRRGKLQATEHEFDDTTKEPAASTNNPLVEAQAADIRATLITALGELPDEQREAFLLHEESGMTLDEIGTVTGVGRETVKSRLRYALAKLRKCLPEPATLGIDDG